MSVHHSSADDGPKGHLIAVGGGDADTDILKRALELAGGTTAPVVVVPQASAQPDSGANAAEMWRELGATSITIAAPLDDVARARISSAKLIWMSGGDQNRLVKALDEADVSSLIRQRYRAGAVVGGTSAGAAVMSAVMLTGDADLTVIHPGDGLSIGLGLWPGVIVDQHFIHRQRFNRLLSAVMRHPERVGVGIDESTAVIVSPTGWEIVGSGQVILLDARASKAAPELKDTQAAIHDVRLHVLRGGMKWQP